jgi:hypothetical protein
MNRFEKAIYDCMIPTAELLDETTNPLHRAMLLNFWLAWDSRGLFGHAPVSSTRTSRQESASRATGLPAGDAGMMRGDGDAARQVLVERVGVQHRLLREDPTLDDEPAM